MDFKTKSQLFKSSKSSPNVDTVGLIDDFDHPGSLYGNKHDQCGIPQFVVHRGRKIVKKKKRKCVKGRLTMMFLYTCICNFNYRTLVSFFYFDIIRYNVVVL